MLLDETLPDNYDIAANASELFRQQLNGNKNTIPVCMVNILLHFFSPVNNLGAKTHDGFEKVQLPLCQYEWHYFKKVLVAYTDTDGMWILNV